MGECPPQDGHRDTQRAMETQGQILTLHFPGKGQARKGGREREWDEGGQQFRVLPARHPGVVPTRGHPGGAGALGGPTAINRSPAPDLGERIKRKDNVTIRHSKRELQGWD